MLETSSKKPVSFYLAIVFSIFVGIASILSAKVGYSGNGRAVDTATALPNLITGLCSVVGAIAYYANNKLAIPIYLVAVVGHFASHYLLISVRGGWSHVPPIGLIFLIAVPLLSLAVLVHIIQHFKPSIQK